ncbi:helix-turn-helix domain-containing protein [bacterium]|nr:helix-turn-helix domain-containing protein [bacterium]
MQSIELGHTGVFGALILFGAFQGYSLSTVFWLRSRGDRVANRLLGTLILLITLHLSEIFLDITGLLARVPHLSAATFPLLFLIGPTFYLYLRRLAGAELRPRPVWLLHLIPAALVVASVWGWYRAPYEVKAAYHAQKTWGGHAELDLRTYVLLFVNVIQNASYAFFGERLLRQRERTLERYVADNALHHGMAAMRKIARAFSGYAGGYLVLFGGLLIWGAYSAEVDTVWLVLIAAFWQVLGYTAIDQPETFAHVPWREVAGDGEDEESGDAGEGEGSGDAKNGEESRGDGGRKRKYAKAPLPPERSRAIWEDVRHLMETERPYLRGDLKLADVAAKLNVSLHHLSQAINRESEWSFLELVNRYRVEEAKRMLLDPGSRNLTVLAIGFEAGFNNKASFNQAFKRYAERTPSEFRKRAG